MKKFLSLFLTICLITSICAFMPLTASAATSGTCGDNLTWTLDDEGTLTISGTGDMYDCDDYGNIRYPWEYEKSVTSVIITNGVTSIGDFAFNNCTTLTSITIPNSVVSIGDLAFSLCEKLTSITIPNGVTSIGWGAFADCTNLTSIIIPNSVKNMDVASFDGCEKLTDVYYSGDEVDWKNIKYHSGTMHLSVVGLTNATIHYNCKSTDNITQPHKNNPTLFADSNHTITLGEQRWITGFINRIYSRIPTSDVNIVCSDENVLSIESQDTMCMSPENNGEQYLVCANAFIKGVSPGNATLTFYYKGEKLGSTDVTVEAVIADTISDEVILKANVLHNNDRYHFYKDTASSPAILLNNELKNGYTENLASTYLFVNDLLSALTLHLENGEELDTTTYYEMLLADILENDSNGIWDKAYSTWKTMYGGYNNKIVQKVAGVVTDLDKVKTLDFIKNNKEKKVLETIIDYSNGQGVLKDVAIEVDVLDKLSLSADLINDFFNAVDEVYAYSAVQQEKIDVLKNIQVHTANDNLKTACNNLIEDIKFAQENAVMYYATNFGKTAISDLFDFSHGMVTGLVLQYITTDTAGVTPYVPGLKEAMAIIKDQL